MRQRVITVPKDKRAEEALDFNEATKSQLIELPIGEDEFQFMYQNGIIELINREGNSNIDDFEDDSVTEEDKLKRVIRALSLIENFENNGRLVQNISNLFKEALERGTGVYFYF
ncbi:hypothetical protein [Ohtaekwangia sp.]|uniref:hypothetical protein n=1 Tax=Ohtaekwangia sp. TaxID=2066019 RepID=UPI002FDCF3DA